MRPKESYRGARRNVRQTVIAGVGEGRRWLNEEFKRLSGSNWKREFDTAIKSLPGHSISKGKLYPYHDGHYSSVK